MSRVKVTKKYIEYVSVDGAEYLGWLEYSRYCWSALGRVQGSVFGTGGLGLYLGLENFVRVLEYLGRSLSNLRGGSEYFEGGVRVLWEWC